MRVFIVTSVRLYADGLARLFRDESGVESVGTASEVEEALERIGQMRPDAVLVDLAMDSATDTIRQITANQANPKVVALTALETEEEIVGCAEAGAAGYVTRESSLSELLGSLEAVAMGELRCTPRISALLMKRVSALARSTRDGSFLETQLTPREKRVLELLRKPNKEIARELNIEVATVKNHVHHIFSKLKVRNRSEAVAMFYQRFNSGL